jgi:hypothetical protein
LQGTIATGGYEMKGMVEGEGTTWQGGKRGETVCTKPKAWGTDSLKYNDKTKRYDVYDGDSGRKVAEIEVEEGPTYGPGEEPKIGDTYKVKYYWDDGQYAGKGTWTRKADLV